MLTLSALLLGVTMTTPAAPPPAPAPGHEVVAPAFGAPPPASPTRPRPELRDPFRAPRIAGTPARAHSDLQDPFAARARAQAHSSARPPEIKPPFQS